MSLYERVFKRGVKTEDLYKRVGTYYSTPEEAGIWRRVRRGQDIPRGSYVYTSKRPHLMPTFKVLMKIKYKYTLEEARAWVDLARRMRDTKARPFDFDIKEMM